LTFDATHAPLTHACFAVQHTELLQQVSVDLQDFLPQHVLPTVAQNGVAAVWQHCLLDPQLVLPQQVWALVTQNGVVPVVQHLGFLVGQGGEQVWALTDAGFHAATSPPTNAPPIRRITPRREVGLASSRARLSMN
jgi:hypothetical protein